jgi:hypothetical protein
MRLRGLWTLRPGWPRAALLALALAVPLSSPARVFFRRGLWGGAATPDSGWLGRTVYAAVFQINGGRARMTVLDCAGPLGTLCRGNATEGMPVQWLPGSPEMRIGLAGDAERVTRFVAVQPADKRGAALFGIEQSRAEFERSLKPGAADWLPGLEGIAGGVSTFQARNEDTRTAVQTVRVPAARAAAWAAVKAVLGASGWQAALAGGQRADRGIEMFLRGRDLCCVLVQPADRPGESVVTVLHKEGAVK